MGTESDLSLERIQVLVVDDDPDTLHMLTVMLTECRANVETATSAGEAISMLQSYQPDVLISDIAMPDEDGFSLISRIRGLKSEAARKVPAMR